MGTSSSERFIYRVRHRHILTALSPHRLVNPYVQPILYIRRPGSDIEETHNFPDDDPFFSEVSVLIDNIEDIEEDPETAQILCSYEGEHDSARPAAALRYTLMGC